MCITPDCQTPGLIIWNIRLDSMDLNLSSELYRLRNLTFKIGVQIFKVEFLSLYNTNAQSKSTGSISMFQIMDWAVWQSGKYLKKVSLILILLVLCIIGILFDEISTFLKLFINGTMGGRFLSKLYLLRTLTSDRFYKYVLLLLQIKSNPFGTK